jgi:hypothetical protein
MRSINQVKPPGWNIGDRKSSRRARAIVMARFARGPDAELVEAAERLQA